MVFINFLFIKFRNMNLEIVKVDENLDIFF